MDDELVQLNVGGQHFTVTRKLLLTTEHESKLNQWFIGDVDRLPKDNHGRYFIDRDGTLFRLLIDALRNEQLQLPDQFNEWSRLYHEAEYYGLERVAALIKSSCSIDLQVHQTRPSSVEPGYLTIGYHGTFSFGRQGISSSTDVNFRKISRILVCGRVSLCKYVFGDTLNDGRDPDRGELADRYTSRFFLKHSFVEQAFDALAIAGFRLVGVCGTGTNGPPIDMGGGGGGGTIKTMQISSSTEEDRWAHYNQFVFCRP